MDNQFNSYERIYWVFTQLCNDECMHCYNNSGPHGERISEEDCLAIIDNLPDELQRLTLSGGEPLADRKLLYKILERLQEKYDNKLYIALQFNGDLLTPTILQDLIIRGIDRFSIASIDRYHKNQGERQDVLASIFEEQGIVFTEGQPMLTKTDLQNARRDVLTYGFFGSTEDMWLGGNWARGRSMENNIWKQNGMHNFCAIPSGAVAFLGNEALDLTQEISIQLWKINPCCPGTVQPLGDARKEKIADVLNRASKSEVMRKLNDGEAYAMGESLGISEQEGLKRAIELKNICLWCDEFFTKHYDIQKLAPKFPLEVISNTSIAL